MSDEYRILRGDCLDRMRELVRKLHDELVSCEENEYIPGGHKFDGDVRELGMEVDG